MRWLSWTLSRKPWLMGSAKDMPGLDMPGVIATAERILAHIVATPVHVWRGGELESRVGADTELVLKLELFQRTGSFKARGAVNSVAMLSEAARARGVTTFSSGNHAIATAYAASRFGISARLVMLATADPARVSRARRLGAEVLLAGSGEEAYDLARRIEAQEGRAFIHPYEGRPVLLGTAALGLEFCEQSDLLDAVIIPIGGGGLCAGVSWAFKALRPDCVVYGVEPAGADVMHRSFAAGEPQSRTDVATIATSLGAPFTLPLSFSLCQANVDRLVLVEDDAIVDAMGVLFRDMKLAVEPAAAAATAALLGPLREELRGKRVGIIICGTNICTESYTALLERAQTLSEFR